MLTLISIKKSSNPLAKVQGDYNVTSDGRLYYIAEFKDSNNPFETSRDKTIFQQFKDSENKKNPIWKGGDPHEVRKYIGKNIDGRIITAKVEEYMLGDKLLNVYTCVVLGHENIENVFKNAGHPLITIDKTIEETLDNSLMTTIHRSEVKF